jgi:hypothetical protein
MSRVARPVARFGQRHLVIGPKRDLLLLAAKPIGEAPEPAAVGANQQIEPVEVSELGVALGWPSVANEYECR